MKKFITLIFSALLLASCTQQDSVFEEADSHPETSVLVSNDYFLLQVPGELYKDEIEGSARFQNYEATEEPYTLKDGEYYVEIFYGDNASEQAFKNLYKTIDSVTLAGKSVQHGTEKNIMGDGNNGEGYLAKISGDYVLINISSESATGIENAMSVVETIEWKE
jgi:hypothetical protein